jgi:hypothetical protein
MRDGVVRHSRIGCLADSTGGSLMRLNEDGARLSQPALDLGISHPGTLLRIDD